MAGMDIDRLEGELMSARDFTYDDEDEEGSGNRSADEAQFVKLRIKTARREEHSECKLCRLPPKGLPNLPSTLRNFYLFEQALIQGCEDNPFHSRIQQYFNKNLVRADKETKDKRRRLNLAPITLEEVQRHYTYTAHLPDRALMSINKQIREVQDICDHFGGELLWRKGPNGTPVPDIPNQKSHQEYLKVLQGLMNSRDKLLANAASNSTTNNRVRPPAPSAPPQQ